ncbi:MAG: pyridoxal-phosphate dependent enzyme [Pyrodictiaceae archaeon]
MQKLNTRAFFYCSSKGVEYPIDDDYNRIIEDCGRPLTILYDYEHIEWKPKGRGLQRYSFLLPLTPPYTGEGSTPLVEAANAVFKLDYMNPSGSFKDRGTLLALSYAKLKGWREVIEDTSGNTGISIAFYANILGMRATIIMPAGAPEGKKKLVKLLGGRIIEARDRSNAREKAIELVDEKHYYVNHLESPFYIEGAKTIAFEIFEDIGVPDTVIAPIGSGGLILGVYKGFQELRSLGLTTRIPRLVGIQGCSAPPVYEALHGKINTRECSSHYADGIMVRNPPRLAEIVEAIRKSGGTVILVDNNDVRRGLRELISMGFIVEPTSAVVWAGIQAGQGGRGDSTSNPRTIRAAILTGSGLKMLDFIASIL